METLKGGGGGVFDGNKFYLLSISVELIAISSNNILIDATYLIYTQLSSTSNATRCSILILFEACSAHIPHFKFNENKFNQIVYETAATIFIKY